MIGGNQCDAGIYTKRPCSPWRGVTEDECKQKCFENELNTPGCTPKKCVYVQYKSDVKNCHFADETCVVIDKGLAAYSLWRRRGRVFGFIFCIAIWSDSVNTFVLQATKLC